MTLKICWKNLRLQSIFRSASKLTDDQLKKVTAQIKKMTEDN